MNATHVIEEISPRDDMFRGNPRHYFRLGHEAVVLVHRAMETAGIEQLRTILDLPSGHGRVMRTLKAAFPKAQLTACDIDRDAVDFCAQTFGAIPVYGEVDPRDIAFRHEFDLIWCGSLFTHLEAERFGTFLELFETYLAPGGLLVLTTNGTHTYRMLLRLLPHWDTTESQAKRNLIAQSEQYFPIPKEVVGDMVKAYDEEGFAYADYQFMDNFGATLSSPSWVCKQLERLPSLRLVAYVEQGWDSVQDAVACIRRTDET